MQTNFSLAQLADPAIAESERILRACVHCGFCTATCPTYVLLGDERDSPRGRIYLIKDMLEHDRPATAEVVKHIDRCLSCLSCMTTCPSGVNYMHLVDHARVHIERTFRRPLLDRWRRAVLAKVMPDPRLFRLALIMGLIAGPFAPVFAWLGASRLAAILRLAEAMPVVPAGTRERTFFPKGERAGRVAILSGCANQVLKPSVNAAAIRLLNRHGIEVVLPEGEGCCGAIVHHLGREPESLEFVRRNIDAWTAEIEGRGLDAILATASGCGTMIKDYGFLLRNDPAYATNAARVAGLTLDISEYLMKLRLTQPARDSGLVVAYQAACSLQHGQKVVAQPRTLLVKAGFAVRDVPEGHLCCGSAGTYNMLQPEIASRLRDRKLANIAALKPDVIATGNVGCMAQLKTATAIPIVHTVELLDWATGGPRPAEMKQLSAAAT
ncbi:MAG TPA: glycolate oxidase subunit GlcF [Xanthobacteraceae bacterium]|nr:glycolate oxidase subunit GlcF [Xanthobacteraceae bacterium]